MVSDVCVGADVCVGVYGAVFAYDSDASDGWPQSKGRSA